MSMYVQICIQRGPSRRRPVQNRANEVSVLQLHITFGISMIWIMNLMAKTVQRFNTDASTSRFIKTNENYYSALNCEDLGTTAFVPDWESIRHSAFLRIIRGMSSTLPQALKCNSLKAQSKQLGLVSEIMRRLSLASLPERPHQDIKFQNRFRKINQKSPN